MNKKLTVKNEFGKIVYCVLSSEEAFEKQMMQMLSLRVGYGFTVDFGKEFVKVKDARTNETVGTFEILSLTDTSEDVVLDWQE